MAIDTNPQSFSNTEMLRLVRFAIAQVLVGGQAYAMPGGRQFTRADLKELRDMESAYEMAVAMEDAGANGSGNVLVRYSES